MELSRRDALAALAGAGILAGSTAAALSRDDLAAGGDAEHGQRSNLPSTSATVDALVATAEVVYPGEVENLDEFVETFAVGRLREQPDHRLGTRQALSDLQSHTRLHFDRPYTELDVADRDAVLRKVGADTADPDPDGTTAERVRYYLVNDVLFALYTSPAGGRLVGIENPQGHPGGTDSYQRGPTG